MFKLDRMKQQEVVTFARKYLGTVENPWGSNAGPLVHLFQSVTRAYNLPWCVSFVQFVWNRVFRHTLAGNTAGAYELADWAVRAGRTSPVPVVGGPVVYHIGEGHAGIVASTVDSYRFFAIEGNENNGVRWVERDRRMIQCTFICPVDLIDNSPPKPVPIKPAPVLRSEHGKGE